ncbi:MAG: cupin domain-containing protein [Nitrososphaerales archaeon]
MPKKSGAKIRINSVKEDRNLRRENGWNKMQLRWLINERSVGSKSGVLGHTVFPPGASHEAHIHEKAEEYIIITKGRGSQLVGKQTFDVRPGDVVYVPKGTVHATRNSSKRSNLVLFFAYAGAPTVEKTGYRLAKD